MSRRLLALVLLASCAIAAQASPAGENTQDPAAHKDAASRLGDSIQRASDHAAQLVTTAMNSIGVPYRRGGSSAETGFDCSGFVRSTFEQAAGLLLPRRAAEQARATARIEKSELQPGDLVFFNTLRRAYSHVGIYLGEGRFIHSPRAGARVRIEDMHGSYWSKRFNGARRVLQGAHAPADQAAARPYERPGIAPTALRLGGAAMPPQESGAQSQSVVFSDGI